MAVATDPPQIGEPLYPELADQGAKHGNKLSEATLDAVARMLVSGASVAQIAAATGLTASRVRTIITGSGADRIDAVRGEVMRQTATHYFELLAMLPEVRVNIRGGLGSAEEKVRLETSKWLHDTLIPKPAQRVDTDQRHSFTPEVGEFLSAIASSFEKLAAVNLNRGELPVRVGPDALPRPVVERE